jgi:hypothetical protein
VVSGSVACPGPRDAGRPCRTRHLHRCTQTHRHTHTHTHIQESGISNSEREYTCARQKQEARLAMYVCVHRCIAHVLHAHARYPFTTQIDARSQHDAVPPSRLMRSSVLLPARPAPRASPPLAPRWFPPRSIRISSSLHCSIAPVVRSESHASSEARVVACRCALPRRRNSKL